MIISKKKEKTEAPLPLFYFFSFLFMGSTYSTMCFDPLCHFFVSLPGECARRVCSDEFGCEPEEFLMRVFADIRDDLFFGVCWVGMSGVFECAFDSDLADCFKFVCVADNVADEGVVWRQEGVVVAWCTFKDCFVFRAVRYMFDDFLELVVVADVFVAEVVKGLLKRAVVVVLVVCDVVEPSGGDGVHNQVAVLSAVGEVLLDDV